jgi:hypothetical protein
MRTLDSVFATANNYRIAGNFAIEFFHPFSYGGHYFSAESPAPKITGFVLRLPCSRRQGFCTSFALERAGRMGCRCASCSRLANCHADVCDAVHEHITNFHFGEDVDRQRLVDSGWRVIPKTGLFAFELDGFLLLGIDGIGYDFFDAHWRPLYELLELGWHLDD